MPKTHAEWWLEKLSDNQERDKRKTLLIQKHGWLVLRYWEHEIRHGNATKVAASIYRAVMKRVDVHY